MRLIDADDFKETINLACHAFGWLEPVTTAIKEYICKQVDAQITVDSVDVVRCRDCKHFAGDGMYCDNDIMVLYDRFYCYYGEKEDCDE